MYVMIFHQHFKVYVLLLMEIIHDVINPGSYYALTCPPNFKRIWVVQGQDAVRIDSVRSESGNE